ncbi:MAG: type II secretion system protein [Planctomycetota bacterium]
MTRSRPGYTMLEIVAVLSLMVIFLMLAGTLVRQAFVIQRQAVDMEWAVSRAQHAVRDLRRDVWSASAIEVDADGTLRLQLRPGDAAQWAYAADPSTRFPGRGWLTRSFTTTSEEPVMPGLAQRYEVPQPIGFIRSPIGVRLTVGDHEVPLVSQVLRGRRSAVDPTGDRP